MKKGKYEARSNLIRLCDLLGVGFQQYGRGNHFRLFGEAVIDYWPGTSRAWQTGSMSKGFKIAPEDAVTWAKTGMRP
jgi:hypothetical protein